MASAHILYETGALSDDQAVRFHTQSGLLTVRRNGDGTLTMNFPATTPEETEPPPELGDVFGIELVWTGRSPFDIFVEADGYIFYEIFGKIRGIGRLALGSHRIGSNR